LEHRLHPIESKREEEKEEEEEEGDPQ